MKIPCSARILIITAILNFGVAEVPGDEVKQHLETARQEYQVATKMVADQLMDSLREREQAAVEAGALIQVESTRAEIQRFEQTGELPASVSLKKYRAGITEARSQFLEALEAAQKALTKANRIDEAKAIQAEVISLREKQPFGEVLPVLAPELLDNPGSELPIGNGTIPGWKSTGGPWSLRSADPSPQEGIAYFFPPAEPRSELNQEVSIADLQGLKRAEVLELHFRAFVRSYDQDNPDSSRIIVEFLDGRRRRVIDSFDSGAIRSRTEWKAVQTILVAPESAKWVRVRLISTRHGGKHNDGYFDSLSLRPCWRYKESD